MKKNVSYLLILALIVLLVWFISVRFFGLASLPVLLAVVLVAAALVWFSRKVPILAWIVIGLLVLGLSLVPTARITQHLATPPEPLNSLITTVLFWLPSVALILAAKLLYSGINLQVKARSGADGVENGGLPAQRKVLAYAALTLSALLVLKTLFNLYWLTVWDNSDDSIGYMYLIMPGLACMVSAIVLFVLLPWPGKLAGFGPLLLIALMVALSGAAQRVDYRQLTQARAARVAQAVEAYRARKGQYPPTLRLLTPWYALALPGPLVLYGQDWCYAAGAQYFRLGYVEREHWSAPSLIVHVFKTAGEVPVFPPACSAELAVLMKDLPGYWTVSEAAP